MIDKYLRNDSDNYQKKIINKNKFLIKKKEEDEMELEYKKYLSKHDDDVDFTGNEDPAADLEYNEKNFLMKPDAEENYNEGEERYIIDNKEDLEDKDIIRNFNKENRNLKNMVTFQPNCGEINELIDTPLP